MTLDVMDHSLKGGSKNNSAKPYTNEPATPVRIKVQSATATQPLRERSSKLGYENRQWNSEPRAPKPPRNDRPTPIEAYFRNLPAKYHAFGNNRSKLVNLRAMAEALFEKAHHMPLPSSAHLMAGHATETVIESSARLNICSRLFGEIVLLLYASDSTLSKSVSIVPKSRHSSRSPPMLSENSAENEAISKVPRLGPCKHKPSVLLEKICTAKSKPPAPGSFAAAVHCLWAGILSILVRNERETLYTVLAEAASRVFDDWASDEKVALSCVCFVHICRSMLVYGIKTSPDSTLACLGEFDKLLYSDTGVLSGPLRFLDTHDLEGYAQDVNNHHDDVYDAECEVLVSTQDINDFISDFPSSSLPSTDFGPTTKRRTSEAAADYLRKRLKPQTFSFTDNIKALCRIYDWTFDLIDSSAFRLSDRIIRDIKLSTSFELLPHHAFPEARIEKALVASIRSTEEPDIVRRNTEILGCLFPGSRATCEWYLSEIEGVSAAVALAIQLASGLSIEEILRLDVSDVATNSSKGVSLCGVRLPWVASEALLRYIAFIKPMQFYCAANPRGYHDTAMHLRHILFATISTPDSRFSPSNILEHAFGRLESAFDAKDSPISVIKEQLATPRNKWLAGHEWATVNVGLYNYSLNRTSIVDLPTKSE